MDEKNIIVAPSILSADFSDLGKEVREIEKAGADWVHIDVMDGFFVPNITIGPVVIKSLRKITDLIFDVHLMIDNPGQYVESFAEAGSDIITFHIESLGDPRETIEKIKREGKRAGISVKPGTDIKMIEEYLGEVDMVLVMTVEPGFGGQKFMADMMDKVRFLKERYEGIIQVDGGINSENVKMAIEAGATAFVAGTYVFGSDDYAEAIRKLKQ